MKRHPSRLVPFGLAAVLVLAACGSDEPTADDSSADGSVPAAEDSQSADDGLLAPRPIEVSGGGAGSGSPNAAPEAASADREMSTDMMIAPYRIVTFVPGEGLPALPTNDVGYVFQAGATVTAEQVAELAAQLGVEGEPVRHEEGSWAWWQVGPNDGTAPSLTVNEDAQLGWNYSSSWADQAVTGAGCAVAASAGAPESVPADADATTIAPAEPVCETPPPPEGVPSAEEAEARTRELMSAVGLDPDGWKFETYADEWYAGVTATEQLDGAFAGRSFGAGFGAEGVMQYASGQLAEPVRVGPYPLIDLETAIARLNDPSGFYSGGGFMAVDAELAREVYPETGVAVDVPEVDVAEAAPPPVTEPAIEPPAPPASDVVEPPVTPVPVEVPAPEEVTVTLVDVQADVWWAFDVDGSVWLLPAYRFIGDDGGWYTVPAVTDEFLIQVPVDTAPPASVEPAPAPETVPPDNPTTSTLPVDTVADVTPLESSVGKTLGEFRAEAEALGLTVRVVEQDGVPLAVTMDYNPTRVNVAVEGEGDAGIVIRIDNVG
jgi:hypothetical protein